MKLEEFMGQLSESVEEAWGNYPPRIELKGWWWKKYIPHYRRMQKLIQQLLDRKWMDEHENIKKELNRLRIEEIGLDPRISKDLF